MPLSDEHREDQDQRNRRARAMLESLALENLLHREFTAAEQAAVKEGMEIASFAEAEALMELAARAAASKTLRAGASSPAALRVRFRRQAGAPRG